MRVSSLLNTLVLKPGGTLLVSLLENSSADIAGDIILKSAGSPALRHKEENIASKAHHHFLENMIEKTNLSILHVTNDEYPIKLGNSKEFAFKALTIPIRSELQELNKRGEYHSTDAENAFDDILNEGFMAKQGPNGEMEIPYNVYKFVAARRQFEDGDTARDLWPKHINHGNSMKRARPLTPYDARHDPVVFDTWVRMKPAASEKITKAVNKQINMYNDSTKVKVLDTAPSPYAETAISIATTHPDAQVIATSKSLNIVEGIRGIIADHGLSNMQVNALDESHLSKFGDKSFDIVISSFGLTFLNSPKQALDEFHRGKSTISFQIFGLFSFL